MDKQLKRRYFWSLHTGRTIFSFTSRLVGIFLPIFFYELLGGNIAATIAIFAAGYGLYVLGAPLAARILNHVGYRKALVSSTVWGTLFYVLILTMEITQPAGFAVFAGILGLLLLWTLNRLSFWLPYHVEFAEFSEKGKRGMLVSAMLATITIASVVGPIAGGYVIDHFGYMTLFIVVLCTYGLAAIPFSRIPDTADHFEWTYTQTWKKLFSKTYRKEMIAMFAGGSENVLGVVVWPLFIFLLLNGSYLEVGAVSGVIVGVTLILQLLAGKKSEEFHEQKKMLRVGSVLYAIGWIIKIFVATAFQIFAVGVYHNLTKIFTITPFYTTYYDIAADQGQYMDEFTILREMAVSGGKAVSLGVVIVISLFLSIEWAFLIGAAGALLLNIAYAQGKEQPQSLKRVSENVAAL